MNKICLVLLIIYCASQAFAGPTYVVTWDGDDVDDQIDQDEDKPLLGSKKCTYGPSYWCHNITQAKECGAMSHCISKVWEKQVLPEDNDDVCKVCKEMVKEARDQLLSNETQDELRQVLEGSCNLIPLKLIAKECDELADNFIPELIDALTSRMDPQVVCSVSGLCNSIRIDEMLKEMKPIIIKKSNDINHISCPRCNYFMSSAFNHLKSLKKKDLRMQMLSACGYMSSYSDSCRMAVMEEFNGIYAQIIKADSTEFCSLVGICDISESTAVAVYKPTDDDLPCSFCKQLVNHMRSWLTDNVTKEEFGKVVQGLCKQTGKYQKDCVQFFHQYGKEIYNLILDDLDAENFCERVGVCPSSTLLGGPKTVNSPVWTILKADNEDQPEEEEAPMLELLPGERLTGNNEDQPEEEEAPMLELLPGERLTGNDEKNALRMSNKCMFCEYVIHEVQNYLANPQTEGEIKTFVDNLCDKYLPKEMSDQCEDFVTNYGDNLIELIDQEIDPTEICPQLKLCPEKKADEEKKVSDVLPTCALCEFTVSKLINLIGKNHTKESIEAATDKVCKMMPKRYIEKCESFMENYGDQVIEMILIEGSAHEICAAVHLCLFGDLKNQPTKKIVAESVIPAELYAPPALITTADDQVTDDTKCVMCEYVITTLATKIKDNATEEEIKLEVEQICKYLPQTVTKNCKNFVEMYGDLVIQYLAQEMDPAQVCTELKLCKPKVKDYKLSLTRCELCTVIADYLSMKLEDENFVKNYAITVSNKFCPLLRNLKGECTEMMEDYGPYLMSLLAQEDQDKDNVCKLIDIC